VPSVHCIHICVTCEPGYVFYRSRIWILFASYSHTPFIRIICLFSLQNILKIRIQIFDLEIQVYTYISGSSVAARSKLYWLLGPLQFLKKVRQTAITICSGLLHPTLSHSRIVCRGWEGPKGSRFTLRPAFQAKA
jgi:hypothetical protein